MRRVWRWALWAVPGLLSLPAAAVGAITQPPIHWIDRPTFQQAVQIP